MDTAYIMFMYVYVDSTYDMYDVDVLAPCVLQVTEFIPSEL